MTSIFDAFLASWPFEPGLLVGIGVTAFIYLRGWIFLHRRDPRRWSPIKAAAFLLGLAAVALALASPIEPFSFLFLQVHMLQHLLLMMIAPPLLWLGDPLFPFLRGVPTPVRTDWLAPWFRSRTLRGFFGFLTHPVPAWTIYVATTWAWHLPALYELALRSDGWHTVQHLMFFGASLLFWHPVVRPYPSQPRWSRWLLVPYLLLADIQNTILAALLSFSAWVLYPHYEQVPRLGGLSALDDQATAGVIMWVPGSLVYLIPLFVFVVRWLAGDEGNQRTRARYPVQVVKPRRSHTVSLPLVTDVSATPWDLLRAPLIGQFLRWRHARTALQLPLLVLAVMTIHDGLNGPDVAPINLAGVLPWIHWRGFLILGLLVAGNVFCMSCPFMLPRMLARRLFSQPFQWPRQLRNKWLACALLVIFLWSYETFSLWDGPRLTAWIAAGYFVGALVIDSLFRGAVFCKYVCPIGQFNFVQSLLSPWQVQVRAKVVCARCQTKDCIRGRPASTGDSPAPAARGCELDLFLPRKAGNMDCTLCLDCIHACPHDNIGIVPRMPGGELWRDPSRSGIGRFGKRRDLAALLVLLVFGAFANAAGMVGPVIDWQDRLIKTWDIPSPFWITTAYYGFALILLPALTVGAAGAISYKWGRRFSAGWGESTTRFAYALLPLGFAMWLCHYSFHLLMSYDTVIPAAQRFAAELGVALGSPDYACSCCRPVMPWLPRFEIVFLDFGLLLSLYTAYRIAMSGAPNMKLGLRSFAPWATLIFGLFALGIWIVLQPMQMRGTMSIGG